MKREIVDISRSVQIIDAPPNGLPRIVPYVLCQTVMPDGSASEINHHTQHWLEYCPTTPTDEMIDAQPDISPLQTPANFTGLGTMLVSLNGVVHIAFKAICRRDQGTKVGIVRLGHGCLFCTIP